MSPNNRKSIPSLLDELSTLGDREIVAEFLIETAQRFKEVPPEIAVRPFPESHRVPACESEAYIWARKNADGNPRFYFAVENPQGVSAKALAVILDEAVSDLPAHQVAGLREELVYDIFGRQISMGRGEGLKGMIRLVKALAQSV